MMLSSLVSRGKSRITPLRIANKYPEHSKNCLFCDNSFLALSIPEKNKCAQYPYFVFLLSKGTGFPVTHPILLSLKDLTISSRALSEAYTSPSVRMNKSSLLLEAYSWNKRLRAYDFPSPGSKKNLNRLSLIFFFRNFSTSGKGSTTVTLRSFLLHLRKTSAALSVEFGSLKDAIIISIMIRSQKDNLLDV